MLTKRQNMLETIRGGSPDRFVNQFEALGFIMDTPYSRREGGYPEVGGETVTHIRHSL